MVVESRGAWSEAFQQRYGEGYFRGEGSGFAAEGYQNQHASWLEWMDFVRQEVGAAARWLDLGCAYGFLVAEARRAGFQALGIDASRFALEQIGTFAPDARGRVARAFAERLPFRDRSFAVVSAFDILEHLPEPGRALDEIARLLCPGGLLLAATPDPLHFDRHEPTHLAEAPPAVWVRRLEERGFVTAHRFRQALFNLEIVARRGGSRPLLAWDALGQSDRILESGGDPALRATLRQGFETPAAADGSRLLGDGAGIHLLNAGEGPLEIRVEIDADAPDKIELDLAGCKIGRANVEYLTILLPSGGHDLRFRTGGAWPRVQRIRLNARRVPTAKLCQALPFDLYERYSLLAGLVKSLAPDARTLLDVGGAMAADAGHLGWVGDFLPGLDARSVDTRWLDLPRHGRLLPGASLPFEDRAIDVVCSLDVLEHVEPTQRKFWLEELWRVTRGLLVVAAPFDTEGVIAADAWLYQHIKDRYGYEAPFLREHIGLGLPGLEVTLAMLRRAGAEPAVLSSGPLPLWRLGHELSAALCHPVRDARWAAAMQEFNSGLGFAPALEPAYRHVLVADRRQPAAPSRWVAAQPPAEACDLASAQALVARYLRQEPDALPAAKVGDA